jgi:hypothetical protein
MPLGDRQPQMIGREKQAVPAAVEQKSMAWPIAWMNPSYVRPVD